MDAVCVFATQQIVTYADPPGLCCAWVYATTIYTTARTDAAHNNHASTARLRREKRVGGREDRV